MRASPEAAFAALILASGGLVGCALQDTETWSDQLTADGSCWNVDLADGLDPETTAELQTFFDCLDAGGVLQPLRPVTDAMDAPGPNGEPVGLGLIDWFNRQLSSGFDLSVSVQEIARLLDELGSALQLSTKVFIELVYGVPFRDVATEVDLGASESLEAGVVVPALPVVGELAWTAATDNGALVGAAHDALAHPAVPDLACTVVAVAGSSDPDVQASLHGLPQALGEARRASLSPENDRWGYATGDSLRDLTGRLVENDSAAWRAIAEPTARLLRTDGLAPKVQSAFSSVILERRLAQLPLQLRYLATVTVDGRSLGPGEGADRSALTSLLRLLARSNQPAVCSVDLGLTDIEIDLGNVSVALLEFIARQDPDQVAGALDLFSGVLGFALTDDILDLIAGTEACPVIDHRFVDDLESLDRLTDRESEDLLYAAVYILAALEGAGSTASAVPDLADTVQAAYEAGLVEPTGVVLIDLADSTLLRTFIAAIPWMIDPSTLAASSCPSGTQPLTFESGWHLLDDVVAPRTETAALARLGPTVAQLAADSRVWALLDNTTPLLLSTDAQIHLVPETFASQLTTEPDFGVLDSALNLLADESSWMPFVALVATPEIRSGLATTDAPEHGPLPYLSRLVLDGTLDDLLRTLSLAAELLTPSEGGEGIDRE